MLREKVKVKVRVEGKVEVLKPLFNIHFSTLHVKELGRIWGFHGFGDFIIFMDQNTLFFRSSIVPFVIRFLELSSITTNS